MNTVTLTRNDLILLKLSREINHVVVLELVEAPCAECGMAHTLADQILRRDLRGILRKQPRLDARTMQRQLHDTLLFVVHKPGDERRLRRTYHAVCRARHVADEAGHGPEVKI